MGSILTNGVFLPAEGERNCYEGLAANWTALDGLIGGYNVHIGNTAIHVTAEDKATWNGKADASALTAHTGNTTIHVTSADKQAWDGHVADSVKHVTAEDKQAWNGKADASALTAHTGNTTIHVTAEDKAKWNAVTSKANDADVMHLSGNESASGDKNFKGLITTSPDSTLWPISTRTTDDITFLHDSAVHVEQRGSGNLTDLSNGAWNIANLGIGCFFFRNNSGTDIRYKNFAQNTVNRIPVVSGANRFINDATPNQDNTYNLGSSSLRWRTINGLEPSSLGMPDLANGVDISGYINVGDVDNTYTPPANGWIWIRLIGNSASIIQGDFGINSSYVTNNVNNQKWVETNLFVTKNIQATIRCRGITGLVSVKFYPCQGNI